MIEGTLVNLRAPDMGDLERNTRWVNDRDVTRYLVLRYQMPGLAEENWLRERCTSAPSYHNTFFAIDTKDGVHIGNTNLFNAPPETRSAEAGIMIGDKDYWSRGYGTDAMRTLLGFGFDEMNLHRIHLWVYAFNDRAQSSYRKCGFVDEARLRQHIFREGAYHDVVQMSILRHEFYAARETSEEEQS